MNFTAFCPGHADFYGRTFHCWRPAGTWHVDLHKAIVDSCDVFFYTLGQRLGIDRIHKYGRDWAWAGARASTCRAKNRVLMPSEEWKERVYHQKWYAGETISVAIGQGAVTVTPVQLART
jgi:penicillin-binding protein 2